MTEQEIEKLREKLGDGFEVTAGYNCAVITVKDIWKGVEFADFKGSVFKIDKFDGLTFYENGWSILKSVCKPSTESAYVEQLKAKAHELFGDIKDGDRFELDGDTFTAPTGFDMRYFSDEDLLLLDNYMQCPYIYKQGRWAKKVEEPIRVEFVSSSQGPTGNKTIAWFQFELTKHGDIHPAGTYLAECLQSYLNKS